jgi:predicted RNA-binding Zn-ribbon protein involved in translation (DUF1610 family)
VGDLTDDFTQEAKGEEGKSDLTGYARYRHLKANVRRRRALYKLLIILALAAVGLAVVDILLLGSILKFAVLGVFAVLLIWGILMMLSSRRGREELADIDRLQRTLLQCPECKNVFQYGEIHFDEHQKAAFTCPVCGAYGALPDPTSPPVKAVVPEGDLKVRNYVCTNCKEEIEVGTYGDQPLYDVRFRSCPRCGQAKFIQKKPERQPGPVNPV